MVQVYRGNWTYFRSIISRLLVDILYWEAVRWHRFSILVKTFLNQNGAVLFPSFFKNHEIIPPQPLVIVNCVSEDFLSLLIVDGLFWPCYYVITGAWMSPTVSLDISHCVSLVETAEDWGLNGLWWWRPFVKDLETWSLSLSASNDVLVTN